MAESIGGTKPLGCGRGGNINLISILAIIVVSILAIIILRYVWLWWSRIRSKVALSDKDWVSDCSEVATAKITDAEIDFSNVRDFTWRTLKDHDVKWIDVKVNADEIVDVWYVIDHFHKVRGLAHTMLSFEFKDGTVLTFSFECRREVGEKYHPWDGLWRSYELYLLVSTERDALYLRTNSRSHKVHLFRAQTPPGKEKALLLQLCQRLNQLSQKPEWYHTLTASCATAIVEQVNAITPGRIPFMWRTFLPGHSARAAWKLKLIEDWGGYEETLAASRIDQHATNWDGKGDYSRHIRENLPPSPHRD